MWTHQLADSSLDLDNLKLFTNCWKIQFCSLVPVTTEDKNPLFIEDFSAYTDEKCAKDLKTFSDSLR